MSKKKVEVGVSLLKVVKTYQKESSVQLIMEKEGGYKPVLRKLVFNDPFTKDLIYRVFGRKGGELTYREHQALKGMYFVVEITQGKKGYMDVDEIKFFFRDREELMESISIFNNYFEVIGENITNDKAV